MKKTLKRIVTYFLILSLLLPVMSLVSFASDDRTVTIIEEDISKRSEREKHFICSDGSIVAVSYSLPVHRQNEAGIFEEIDNRLSYDPLTKCYENKNNGSFSVSLSASGQGKAVTVRSDGAPMLSFSTTAVMNGAPLAEKLSAATITAQTAEKKSFSGQKLSKADFTLNFLSSSLTVQGSDVSGRYTLVGDGVKEDVIVQTPGVTAFVTEYTVSSLTLTSDKDGSLIFENEKDEPVYSVSAPYTYDAAGSECPDTVVTFTRTADGYRVLYTPDARWMASEERVYPITFDPLLEEKTLTSSQLSQKTYTDNGSTVTVTDNKLKLSYDRTASPRVRSSAGIKLSSSAYPTINTDVYRINSVQLTLTVLSTEGFTGNFPFAVYRLSEGDHPEEAGFTPTRYQKISSGIVTPTTAKCTFDLSPEDYEANDYRSYLIQPSSTTISGNVEFGNTSSTRTARPVLKVYYSLKKDFTGQTCYIRRTDNGVTRYLSVKENASGAYTVCGDTLPYRWVFAYDHYHDGDYMLRSVEHPNLYLSSDGGITVKSYSTSAITDHDVFWTLMPAAGGYLFRPYSGNGFLHLNPSDGGVTLSTSSGIDEHTWIMLDKIASLCNPEAGGFLTPASETSVHFVSGIAKEENWLFFPIGNNTFRILSEEYPGQCLAADATGCLCFTEATFSAGNSSQIWCLTQSNGGYTISNEAYSTYLYAKATAGGFTCSLDTTGTASTEAERVWTFMNYAVPEEVSTISSLANPTLFLKNASAKDYNGQLIKVGADERETAIDGLAEFLESDDAKNMTYKEKDKKIDTYLADIYGDKCAFRIVYDGEHHAYRIMPISSGNGIHRAIAKDANSNNVVLLNNTIYPDRPQVVDTTRLLFVIELQSDDSFVIKLHANTALILTDKGNKATVTLETPAQTGVSSAQKWTFSTYQYIMPNGSKVSYSAMEDYYKSQQFGSPFGTNGRSLIVTSDFGARSLSDSPNDFHKGLDIRTDGANLNLYSPVNGKVIAATNVETNGAGKYVVIDTGIKAYGDSNYSVCIVYMHMSNVNTSKLNQNITANDCLGQTGSTGTSSAHLHYGIFLRSSNMNATDWNTYPLNPLMFLTPDGFVNGGE